jgi:hypothetical protein
LARATPNLRHVALLGTLGFGHVRDYLMIGRFLQQSLGNLEAKKPLRRAAVFWG